jgi:hypothetical protein
MRRALVGLLGALAFTTLLGDAAVGTPGRPDQGSQPDFTVLSVKIRSLRERPYHIFTGRVRDGFIVEIVVKNVGDAPRAGAGKLLILGNGELRPEKLIFQVPRLLPGQKREIEVDVQNSDLGGINSYSMKACASTRRDTKHGNDCRRGPRFAVIPRTWVGTTNSVTNAQIATITTVAQVTFTFDGITNTQGTPGFSGRMFTYKATGSMTSTASGTDDTGCSFSGSADFAVNPSETFLMLDGDLEKYRAQGALIVPSRTIPATVSCPDGGSAPTDLDVGTWLTSPVTRRDPADDFLNGTETDSAGESWKWDLNAD